MIEIKTNKIVNAIVIVIFSLIYVKLEEISLYLLWCIIYINTISQFIILIKYKKNYYNTLISSILSIILHILLVEFQKSIFSLFF